MDYNELVVIRPISKGDLTGFYQLALSAGIGMTSLPKNNDLLLGKINTSLKSFNHINKNIKDNIEDYLFLFVLECVKTKQIIGCSGIVNVGTKLEPAYYLKLDLNNSKMVLENHYQGAAELCSLYLAKDFRKNNNGKLLSRSRLLFMKVNKMFKDKKIIAEMRGYFDENNDSPFWKEVFNKKFNMTAKEAIEIRANGNKQKIIDMIGFDLIDLTNISEDTKKIIGHVHSSTKAAVALLEKEGLKFNNYVDLIDSGPALEGNIANLKTIKNTKEYKVKGFLADNNFKEKNKYIVCNNEPINFRACISEVDITIDNKVNLPESVKDALNLDNNKTVSIVEL